MAAQWVEEAVRTFGRQLGLSDFGFGEAGVAGVTFENGMTLRLECAGESLVMLLGMPSAGAAQLKRLLTAVHPTAQRGRTVRAARLTATGEDVLAVRLGEREVTVDALSVAFRSLWETVRGAAGGNA